MSEAFSANRPGQSASGPSADRLQPRGQPAIARGVRQLEQLAEATRQPPAQQRSALGREALRHLRRGLEDEFGSGERTSRVLDQVRQELDRTEQQPDPQLVAELLRDISRVRRSTAARAGEPAADAPLGTHIDPARLPPTYRRPIQTYFEKLSEQR